MALVLSHIKGTLLICNPKYASCCLSHRICAPQLPAAIYSASAVERATHACFLLCHEIRLEPRRWQVDVIPLAKKRKVLDLLRNQLELDNS